jgi:thiosulfate/3-mercaptopyruvate sulfurtransferase
MYTTLIRVEELKALQAAKAKLVIVDCSFDLMNVQAGREAFEASHIEGAVYAHLDDVLSAKTSDGHPVNAGRHPLPAPEVVAARLAALGIDQDTQVVSCDRNSHMVCGRLWWMLKWIGHEAVAVLDGGWSAWTASSGATASGPVDPLPKGNLQVRPALAMLRSTSEVSQQLGTARQTVLDARATPRFLGEMEPMDPVAGHIPGALNRPFASNFGADGCFKSAQQLKTEFAALLGQRSADSVVHHCGSGVSAVPNIIAMEVAGLGRQALYAGSWSEWCNTPGLPCAKG